MSRFLAAVPALPVADERAAVAFYVEVLGFVELVGLDGEGLAILVRDDVELHLWVADSSAPGAERHLAGSASCRLRVDALGELEERCAALGVVHPCGDPTDTAWGTRELSVSDVDGNLITLFQRLRD